MTRAAPAGAGNPRPTAALPSVQQRGKQPRNESLLPAANRRGRSRNRRLKPRLLLRRRGHQTSKRHLPLILASSNNGGVPHDVGAAEADAVLRTRTGAPQRQVPQAKTPQHPPPPKRRQPERLARRRTTHSKQTKTADPAPRRKTATRPAPGSKPMPPQLGIPVPGKPTHNRPPLMWPKLQRTTHPKWRRPFRNRLPIRVYAAGGGRPAARLTPVQSSQVRAQIR
jgi:hypothetical protein